MPSVFAETLDDRLQLIENSVSRLGTEGHLKGSTAELHVKKLLSEFSPENTHAIRGWVLNDKNEQSNERDILIYNKNSTPSFLFDETTGLIPKESVQYDIQIKSTLARNKIKKSLSGFSEPFLTANARSLVSVKYVGQESPLEAYTSFDPSYVSNPIITIIAAGEGGYYYHSKEKHKFSKYISDESIIKSLEESTGAILDRFSPIENIKINGVDVSDLKKQHFEVHSWHGFNGGSFSCVMRHFLMGFTNGLYSKKFGAYLTLPNDPKPHTFATSVLSPTGEIIYDKYDLKNGFDLKESLEKVSLRMSISEDGSVDYSTYSKF